MYATYIVEIDTDIYIYIYIYMSVCLFPLYKELYEEYTKQYSSFQNQIHKGLLAHFGLASLGSWHELSC